MLVAPQAPSATSASTKDLRARVAPAFRDAVGMQVVCGMQFRKEASQGCVVLSLTPPLETETDPKEGAIRAARRRGCRLSRRAGCTSRRCSTALASASP